MVNHLRRTAFASVYSTSMTPGAAQQILSALTILMGEDGTTLGRDKVKQLREHSNFFRKGLVDRGFQIWGDENSPVIPLMLYYPGKISAFSRECLARNVRFSLCNHICWMPLIFFLDCRRRCRLPCHSLAHGAHSVPIFLSLSFPLHSFSFP